MGRRERGWRHKPRKGYFAAARYLTQSNLKKVYLASQLEDVVHRGEVMAPGARGSCSRCIHCIGKEAERG